MLTVMFKMKKLTRFKMHNLFSIQRGLCLIFRRLRTFSGVYSNFVFLLTLVYRCFHVCSDWVKFHTVLTFLKKLFPKNVYPEDFFISVLKISR